MDNVTPLAWLVAVLLVPLNGLVLFGLLHEEENRLTVSFLDVGQGDAIFIESPTGVQLLIDGGPDRSVLRKLSSEMSFFDRSIDAVLATHPDKDHIAGLSEVIGRYQIGTYIDSGTKGDSSYSSSLQHVVSIERNINVLEARRGMRLHLGGGAYVDILYPAADVSNLDANDGSIVAKVVYGESEFLLTGDASSSIEEELVGAYGSALRSDVLKAGHHGSRTSSSPQFLAAADPSMVVISAGKDNSYGHPHKEVVEAIAASGAKLISTQTDGSITFISNGREATIKEKPL